MTKSLQAADDKKKLNGIALKPNATMTYAIKFDGNGGVALGVMLVLNYNKPSQQKKLIELDTLNHNQIPAGRIAVDLRKELDTWPSKTPQVILLEAFGRVFDELVSIDVSRCYDNAAFGATEDNLEFLIAVESVEQRIHYRSSVTLPYKDVAPYFEIMEVEE